MYVDIATRVKVLASEFYAINLRLSVGEGQHYTYKWVLRTYMCHRIKWNCSKVISNSLILYLFHLDRPGTVWVSSYSEIIREQNGWQLRISYSSQSRLKRVAQHVICNLKIA